MTVNERSDPGALGRIAYRSATLARSQVNPTGGVAVGPLSRLQTHHVDSSRIFMVNLSHVRHCE